MPVIKVALANVRSPSSRDESVEIVLHAMDVAAEGSASILCFPECIVPGYRIGRGGARPNQDWLESAWAIIDAKAAELGI